MLANIKNITNMDKNMDEYLFIYILGNIIGYYLNYLFYVETIMDQNDNYQNKMLMKQILQKCNPSIDKSSCIWAMSRCYTFANIIINCLTTSNEANNMKHIQNVQNMKKIFNENTSTNLIRISIKPDHVFNIIKVNNSWYYISSWMLLYKGIIVKIKNIMDFFDNIHMFFIDKDFKSNRTKKYKKFELFINKYFIFHLQYPSNDNEGYIKINNFGIITQTIYRTGENMITNMLNITNMNGSMINDKDTKYTITMKIYSSDILSNLSITDMIKEIYIKYVKNVDENIFAQLNNTKILTREFEILDDFNELNKLNQSKITLKLLDKFYNFDATLIKTFKYKTKTIQLLSSKYAELKKNNTLMNLTKGKLKNILNDLIKIDEFKGGSSSMKYYKRTNYMHIEPISFVWNQMFFGKTITFHNLGVAINDANNCNIFLLLKYSILIKHLIKNKTKLFFNITDNLFANYGTNTYSIKKKYYSFDINNNKNYICVISITDDTQQLCDVIIIEMNNGNDSEINVIFPETYINNQNDILLNINQFIITNGITIFKDFSDIELVPFKNTFDSSIDLCKILVEFKEQINDAFNVFNLTETNNYGSIMMILIDNMIELTNIDATEKNLQLLLNNNLFLFDIIKIYYDKSIISLNNNPITYGMNIGTTLTEHYNSHDFFKKIYGDLTKLQKNKI